MIIISPHHTAASQQCHTTRERTRPTGLPPDLREHRQTRGNTRCSPHVHRLSPLFVHNKSQKRHVKVCENRSRTNDARLHHHEPKAIGGPAAAVQPEYRYPRERFRNRPKEDVRKTSLWENKNAAISSSSPHFSAIRRT